MDYKCKLHHMNCLTTIISKTNVPTQSALRLGSPYIHLPTNGHRITATILMFVRMFYQKLHDTRVFVTRTNAVLHKHSWELLHPIWVLQLRTPSSLVDSSVSSMVSPCAQCPSLYNIISNGNSTKPFSHRQLQRRSKSRCVHLWRHIILLRPHRQ